MPEARLFDVLGRLRRRGQWLGGAAGLLWSSGAIIVAAILAGWLDLAFELSPTARIAALAIAAVAGVAALAFTIAAEFARFRRETLARRLDRLGATGGQIVAGVDLAALRGEMFSTPQPALTAGLAMVAVQRAAALADQISAARVAPIQPVVRAAAAVALAGGSLATMALLLPGPATAEWLRFSDPYGDHPPYSYITFDIEPGDATVRYGDGLDVLVTCEGRTADGLQLVLQPAGISPGDMRGEIVPMFQEPSGRWRASLTEIKEEQRYFVRARRARSQKYVIRVLTVPEIVEVRFRLTPPAYSRLPNYDGSLPDGGLSGLVGTHVEVRVRSNRPLRAANVRFIGGEQASVEQQWPAANRANETTGTFTLDRACRLEIQVTDVDSERSRDVFAAGFSILPDERPFVRLMEPRATSLATPSTRLPVVISAEDDFGVARLELFRSLNESRYLPLSIPLPDEPPRRTYQTTQLPLAEYGLSPGDEIKLFARVVDNDPAGGKGSESPVVTVRIISEEEFARMVHTRDGLNVLLARYQEAQRRLESLAQEMEQLEKQLAALPADSPLAAELRAALDKLSEQMTAEATEIQRLGQSPLPYQLDQELAKHLQRLSEQLDELSSQTKSLAGSPSLTHGKAAKELKRLREQMSGDREELDKLTGPPLQSLAALYPLMEDEARYVQLYERQRDLAERLSALRGRDKQDDPALKARMRDLEAEQRRIQADLAELLEDIDGHAKLLPKRPEFKELRLSAEQFAMLVRRSEANRMMAQSAAALADFAGTTAHDRARRAAEILESFLSKGQAMASEGEAAVKNSFEPALGQSLSNTLEQLLADAGFGSGGGFGNGKGGYSARRNSLANIGLYGGLPSMSGPSRASARSSSQAGAGEGRYPSGSQDADGTSGIGAGHSRASAGGGEASVPPQYRRKVGRYFQRLADELGTQNP